MAALTAQPMSYPTTAPTWVAASAGGDTLKAADNVRLVVKNGGGSPVTVTIPRYPATDAEGVAEAALTVSVPAGGERWIGPLSGTRYRNPATDNVEVTYSAVTSVTVGVIAT